MYVCFCLCCPDDVLDAISAGRGWEGQGESVHIRQQEELIKPKKILAKIDFDSMPIL